MRPGRSQGAEAGNIARFSGVGLLLLSSPGGNFCLDRPARLLDEAMEPIDPATFRRQIEYYETITEFRRKQRGEAK